MFVYIPEDTMKISAIPVLNTLKLEEIQDIVWAVGPNEMEDRSWEDYKIEMRLKNFYLC